jgi:polyhydroxybutyrate depolymerase
MSRLHAILATCSVLALSSGCDAALTTGAGPDGGMLDSGDAGAGERPEDEPDEDEGEGIDHLADRPYQLMVPEGETDAPAPLIVLLHGYGASGAIQAAYFGILDVAAEQGILVAYPDGLKDGMNRRFWNATDACCNFTGGEQDDVAYLTALIDDVAANHPVDPARVYLVGHSNGGFMAHRMACERSSRIAAIVSLAGVTWDEPAACDPSAPVAVLQVHGDADTTIRYEGGVLAGHVELWTIEGGRHSPGLKKPAWSQAIIGFLLAHPKR